MVIQLSQRSSRYLASQNINHSHSYSKLIIFKPTPGGELRQRFMQTTKQLEDANLKIKNLELQDQEIRKRMAAIADENKEVQDKYQRQELVFKFRV